MTSCPRHHQSYSTLLKSLETDNLDVRKRYKKMESLFKNFHNFLLKIAYRFAQPFLAKFQWTSNWSLTPQGLK